MAKAPAAPQDYPRIQDENSRLHGCLDDSLLVSHVTRMSIEALKTAIRQAIENANIKSGREILAIPPDVTPDEMEMLYREKGLELFRYFADYSNDPASAAHQFVGRHYREVGLELFRNRTLQKERMNSAWRYQYLTIYCAQETGRFSHISDLGAAEADFSARIAFEDDNRKPLNLYISVKNRGDTVGGQDLPKAIEALETVARGDKNRIGPYLCVFGVTIDRGSRRIVRNKRKIPYSVNTEIWMSDYFWPFFTNYSYEEIMRTVLDVLIEQDTLGEGRREIPVPDGLIIAFGDACKAAELVDDAGHFDDAYKLVSFFCNPPKIPSVRRKGKSI